MFSKTLYAFQLFVYNYVSTIASYHTMCIFSMCKLYSQSKFDDYD